MQQHIAIFGGSFDPVHVGHLALVHRLLEAFPFSAFHLIPCRQQVLKGPHHASAKQRLLMLQLAFSETPKVFINDIEIRETTPSFTVTTLQSYRARLGNEQGLTFVLGEDAFMKFHLWHQPDEIINISNLLVLKRRGTEKLTHKLLENHQVFTQEELLSRPAGAILLYDAGDFPVSSTAIREKIKNNENVSGLLTPAVLDYIKDQQLYG